MESILYIGDPHLYHKTPISRLDNYAETILEKLNQALSIPADYYLIGGDIFHKIHIPKEYIKKVIEILKPHQNKQIYSINGNHDLPYSDSNYINQSPLGILYATGFIKPLDVLITEDYEIIGLNYDQKELPKVKTAKKKILVAHKFYGYGNEFDRIDDKYILNFDYVFLGHDHRQYPDLKIANTWIIRPGSLGRLTSGTEDILRDNIQVAKLYDNIGNGIKIDKINLKIKDSSNIFNIAYLELRKNLKSESIIEIDWEHAFQKESLESIEDVLKIFDEPKKLKEKFQELYYEFKKAN